ncbi:MAG: hypothetical protein ISN26_00190, partial [Betaproteobacteria bacterium AqS2]|nr:hypothetical protein [Betaproteobacteria bacterium AqS2]
MAVAEKVTYSLKEAADRLKVKQDEIEKALKEELSKHSTAIISQEDLEQLRTYFDERDNRKKGRMRVDTGPRGRGPRMQTSGSILIETRPDRSKRKKRAVAAAAAPAAAASAPAPAPTPPAAAAPQPSKEEAAKAAQRRHETASAALDKLRQRQQSAPPPPKEEEAPAPAAAAAPAA